MYRIRKSIGWICLAVLVILLLPSIDTFAENSAFHETESKDYQLRYSETRKISAALSIKGNVATCYGTVAPLTNQDCTITVTLYKKDGTKWVKIKTWSGSAFGGQSAVVNKRQRISRGTYKVVAVGKVARETTRAETSEKTF